MFPVRRFPRSPSGHFSFLVRMSCCQLGGIGYVRQKMLSIYRRRRQALYGRVRHNLPFCRFVLSASPDESGLFVHFVEPAAAGRENMIELCCIRLDVEDGRTVEHIDTANG